MDHRRGAAVCEHHQLHGHLGEEVEDALHRLAGALGDLRFVGLLRRRLLLLLAEELVQLHQIRLAALVVLDLRVAGPVAVVLDEPDALLGPFHVGEPLPRPALLLQPEEVRLADEVLVRHRREQRVVQDLVQGLVLRGRLGRRDASGDGVDQFLRLAAVGEEGARQLDALLPIAVGHDRICGVVEPGCEEDDAGVAVVQRRLLRDLLAGADDVPAALEAVEQQRISGARRPEEVEDVLGGLPYDPFVLLAHDGERCRRRAEPFRRPGR